MGLLWSIVNGFFAVGCGLGEIIYWIYLRWWRGHPRSYNTVPGIWLERNLQEVILYGIGQVLFISWPLLLYHIQHFVMTTMDDWFISKETVRLLVCLSALAFGLFTLITLVIPVGARSRYGFLPPTVGRRTGYERVFLGQMEPYLLLSAKGEGAKACLREVLMYVFLIAVIAGTVQYALWIEDHNNMYFSTTSAEKSVMKTPLAAWFDFIYWSAITMSTTGYGDIIPVNWKCKIVAMSELLLGWMYLAGLLPTLINLSVSASSQKSSRDTAPSDVIRLAVLARTAEWFHRKQQPWGGWKGHLSPDLAATACGYLALRIIGSIRNSGKDLINGLQENLQEELNRTDRTADPVGYSIARIALTGGFTEEEFNETVILAKEIHQVDENAPMLLGLVAGVMRMFPFEKIQQTFPQDMDGWKNQYGSHWECYAVLARLLKSMSIANQMDIDLFSQALLKARSPGGSWHGDVMLTSLILLCFDNLKIFETKKADGRAWLLDVTREHPTGLPVIRSLEIWDTGLVLSALASWNSAHSIIEHGVEWLALRSKKTKGSNAWSWSEEAQIICCDTSSLVCSVLSSMQIENCEIETTIRSCVNLLALHTNQSHQCPTFIDGTRGIDNCPIVSARCMALLSNSGLRRQVAANQIISDVVNQRWFSPWFSDMAITQGLVLYYLAPFCDTDMSEVLQLIESLSHVHETKDVGSEAVASALLGLSHVSRYTDIMDNGRSATRQLSKILLAREVLGEWAPSRIGVFGFGRKYADHMFSTTMSFKALLEHCTLH